MLPPGDRRSPTRASLGTASLSISSLLVFSSVAKLESPVTLPPGRARLATKPAPTGSPAFAITMGMVVVALLAANAGAVPVTTIRSTLRRTKSAASSGWRSDFCSANRYSMMRFFPSIHPSLSALAGTPPRGPRYQKQCFYPGNRCGGFSLAAARGRRGQKSERAAASNQKRMDFIMDLSPMFIARQLLISDF